MILNKIPIGLRFNADTLIKYRITEEDLRHEVSFALSEYYEEDYIEKWADRQGIELSEDIKEKLRTFDTDKAVFNNIIDIDYDSVKFSYFDAEDILVYVIYVNINLDKL